MWDSMIEKCRGASIAPLQKRAKLFSGAEAFHAFEQLRQVPNLLVASYFAVGEVGGAILQVERAGEQIEAASEFGDERIHGSGIIGA